MELQKLTLDNVANGAANEIFEKEVDDLLKNIADPNTKTTQARKITLEFTFKPAPGMEYMVVEVASKSKFAPIQPVESSCHLIQRDGRLEAMSPQMLQPSLFDDDENVEHLDERRKEVPRA